MKNVVLIGFMGTGKTSTGRLLAHRLRRVFIDIDKKIELEQGTTIREIFKTHGEAYFRACEMATIAKVSKYNNAVIATGGGAVLAADNIKRLRSNGVIISLSASVEVIVERTARRRALLPLLDCANPHGAVVELLNVRHTLYQGADLHIDTSNKAPQQVVDEIVQFLRLGGYLRGRSGG